MAHETFNPGPRPIRRHFMVNGKREFFRFAANTEYRIIPDDEWELGEWPAGRRHAIIKESAYREITGKPAPKSEKKKAEKKAAERPPETVAETPPEERTFTFFKEEGAQTE